ncbi:hypothetical protein AB0G86_18620 [Streptomyces scabiei]|uniref:hypothetical protein n=1 Tax=Streptomyces scabiei TaxID=1930 RepID=UPI0033BFF976
MTTPRSHTVRTEDQPGAPADFFEPGAHYADDDGFKAPEQTHTFQCEHIALHPRPGAGPRAFGLPVRGEAGPVALPGSDPSHVLGCCSAWVSGPQRRQRPAQPVGPVTFPER